MKDCRSCPSYLDEEAAAETFKRATGSPMCARFGHMLGRPGMSPEAQERLVQMKALDCSAYGEPKPTTRPDVIEGLVVDPDPSALTWTGETVSSCRGCANLVPAQTVYTELNWPIELCAAKGRLIFKPNHECVDCPFAKPGTSRTSTDGLKLRAEYTEHFSIPTSIAVGAYVSLTHSDKEPTTYPTDMPVTPEEAARGIRAWRKLYDPNDSGANKRFIPMPIYSRDFFTEEQRALIPQTGDDEHPELYIDYEGLVWTFAVEEMELDETLALIGPPGVGKTELGRHLAWLMQVPFRRLSISRATEVDDLLGKWVFEGNETHFIEGRLTKAWGEVGVVVIDEPNTGRDEVWQVFRPMTDNSKQLVLDAAKGQRKERNPGCFPILAMNPAWDPRNIGANEIADADGNRLAVCYVDLPPEPVERHIITERCKIDGYDIEANVLDMIMRIARDIREAADPEHGSLPITWGLRPQIAVARKTKWYPLELAYKRAVCDRLEPSTAKMILKFVATQLDPSMRSDPDASRPF